jgi:hypothetical protein
MFKLFKMLKSIPFLPVLSILDELNNGGRGPTDRRSHALPEARPLAYRRARGILVGDVQPLQPDQGPSRHPGLVSRKA